MTEPEIWSYGGVGGTVAVLEDMWVAVDSLRTAAGLLDDAARAASAAVWCAAEPGEIVSGGPAAAAARIGGDLASLADRLEAAAVEYLRAEGEALAAVRGTAVGDRVADVAGTGWWALRWVAAAGLATGPLGVASRASGALGGPNLLGAIAPDGPPPTTALVDEPAADLAAGLLDPAYGLIVAELARRLAECEFEAGEPYLSTVTPTVLDPGRASTSLEDAMRRLREVELRDDGSVEIESTVGADGTVRHVVYIPGTQDYTAHDPNPADIQANLATVTGGMSDSAVTVVRALEAHGVAPEEPVMLAGHSQGGLVALVAAGALQDRYRITTVLTSGAPTGRLAIPAGVAALQLENTRDLVPGLDGARNPDAPNRVTVVHDRRDDGLGPDDSRTVREAHQVVGYAATARAVDAGLTPSTDAWLARARGFLAGGDATRTVYRPVG